MKKPSKKMRLIGLSLALVLLMTLSIGGGVWYFDRGDDTTPGFSDPPKAERTGMIQEGEIYQEEFLREIDPPGSWGSIIPYQDQITMLIIRENAAWLEDFLTGEKIMDIPAEWLAEGRLQEAVFDEEGTLYGAISLSPDRIKIVNRQTEETVELQGECEDILKFAADTRYYYLSDGNSLKIYTHEGELYQQFSCRLTFDLSENGILYYLGSEFVFRAYDVAADKVLYTVPYEAVPRQYTNQIFYEKEQGLIYLNGNNFVWVFDAKDGSFLGNAIENAKSSSVLVNYTPGIFVDGRQTIYFAVSTGAGEIGKTTLGLYRYSITEDTRKDMPYTLRVTAPYRSDYMVRMIQQFEKENPAQHVEYDYAYSSLREFQQNSDKDGYFDRFRTQMLAGDVGDIVMTGGAWSDVYHYFANTELFQDLRPMVEQSELYGELDPVLLNAITIDGQIKGLPLATDYYYAIIDEELCQELNIDLDWQSATWSDVLGLLDQLEGTDCYLFDVMGNTERAFVRMLISNMPDVIDRKNQRYDLRQQWFADLIQQWKAAEERPNFAKKNQLMGLSGKALISVDGGTAETLEDDEVGAVMRFRKKAGRNCAVTPLFSGEKTANRTATGAELYSIYDGSKNKEAAWRLIEIGMRQQLQTEKFIYSGPLNKNAREQRIERVLQGRRQDPDPAIVQLNETFYAQLNTVYASVDTLYDMNKIKESLYKTLWAYVQKGSKISLEETLEKADQQLMVQLYE